MPSTRKNGWKLTPRQRIADLLEGALERSPADETELVWTEARHSRTTCTGDRPEIQRQHEITVLVRVLDRGRVGSHRLGAPSPGDLDNAVRAAMAQSRARQPLPGLPHLPSDDAPLPRLPRLYDRAVAALDADGVARLTGALDPISESAELSWAEARVAVFSSRGLRRGASATAIELAAESGRGSGRGLAVDAARGLDGLSVEATLDVARHRRSDDAAAEPPADLETAVLSPEATARLVALINREAFSAVAYYEGTSLLREHLGVQVFDRALNLRDDGTDPSGLPFPFDLEGTPKRRVELIDGGIPRTPALDQRQAAVLGLQPTGHAIAGADARAENLFLLPGRHDEAALLGLADGGVWVGRLGALECYEPRRLQVRALLSNVRRIRDGRLAEPLTDIVWRTSLLRSLASIQGLGAVSGRSQCGSSYLGCISAPAMVIKLA